MAEILEIFVRKPTSIFVIYTQSVGTVNFNGVCYPIAYEFTFSGAVSPTRPGPSHLCDAKLLERKPVPSPMLSLHFIVANETIIIVVNHVICEVSTCAV